MWQLKRGMYIYITKGPDDLPAIGISYDKKPYTINDHSIDMAALPATLLPRIPHGIILASPNLRLLLADNMLHKDLTRILRLVLPDPAWIPEFTSNAEVLAASHQRIGSTSLGSRGNTIGREVILLTAGDRDKSIINKIISVRSQHTGSEGP